MIQVYKKSVRNLVSDAKPCEPLIEMIDAIIEMPMVDEKCDRCGKCVRNCASGALFIKDGWSIDLGKCILCYDCMDSCDHIFPVPAPHYALNRKDLVISSSEDIKKCETELSKDKTKRIGKSVFIRELDTGSCNACESEINCTSNKYYDLERFGLRIVSSPRHADVILVTGPMTRNMSAAAKKVYDAVPDDKLVIACGACAISGGLFAGGDVMGNGIEDTFPVDIFIPGCPPSPERIIVSVLKAFGFIH